MKKGADRGRKIRKLDRERGTAEIVSWLRAAVAKELGVKPRHLDELGPFETSYLAEVGCDSLSSESVRNECLRELGAKVPRRMLSNRVCDIAASIYDQMLLQDAAKA